MPVVEVISDKEWDKEVLTYFIDEKDEEYDFGYNRIVSLHPDIASIRGKNDNEKLVVVSSYVDKYYIEHQLEIENAKQTTADVWSSVADRYFVELKKIFGPLDFYSKNKITAALSIAKAGVIGEDNASFQIWYKTIKEPAEVRRHFAHEILHFYYRAYLEHKGLFSLASDWNKAEIFNVVILELPQFVSLIGKPDSGYKQHEKYFPIYRQLWVESQNLDDYLLKSERV